MTFLNIVLWDDIEGYNMRYLIKYTTSFRPVYITIR